MGAHTPLMPALAERYRAAPLVDHLLHGLLNLLPPERYRSNEVLIALPPLRVVISATVASASSTVWLSCGNACPVLSQQNGGCLTDTRASTGYPNATFPVKSIIVSFSFLDGMMQRPRETVYVAFPQCALKTRTRRKMATNNGDNPTWKPR